VSADKPARRAAPPVRPAMHHDLLAKINQLEQALAKSNLERERALKKLNDSQLALARVGHDLRQPIHAANLFLGTLRLEKDPQRFPYLVDRMDRSLRGIDDLLTQMLELSQLESGQIEGQARSFPLDPLLETIEARFSSVAKERGLSWKVMSARGLIVKTDPTIMTEILMNLLSNAFRYTQSGGVLLAVRIREGAALVQVWDTGIGIANTNLPKIFDDFYQVRSDRSTSKKNSVGTGLGLGIVKRLAAFLGLAVNVRSILGHGSRFELRVPLVVHPRSHGGVDLDSAAPPSKTLEQMLRESNPLFGSVVLVVDNNQSVLLASRALLDSWGVHVLLARNVAEAKEQIEQSERLPDAIVTDHDLANGEFGFDVMRDCRAIACFDLPALVQSAHDPEVIAQQYSGSTVLRKPIKPEVLFSNLCALQPSAAN
jgi:two-component system, sensor histidine kinase